MATTLKDIAEYTGLSIPTVHQVINNYKVPFADETRKKVLDAAAKLEYRPNLAARSLQSQKSLLIGLLFYGVNYDLMADFCRGLQNVAHAHEYVPAVMAHVNVEEEADNLRSMLDRRIDALIVNAAIEPDGRSNAAQLADLYRNGLPMVEIFGRFIDGAPSVAFDFREGGRAATQHLIDHGHRRIVLFTSQRYRESVKVPGRLWSASEYWQGYKAAMEAAGLDEAIVTYPTSPVAVGSGAAFYGAFDVAESVFKHECIPTAAVCYSSEAAAALAQYGGEYPALVPPRFAAACFASSQPIMSRRIDIKIFPAPSENAGRLAAEMAFEQIQSKPVRSAILGPGGQVTARPGVAQASPPPIRRARRR